MALKFPVRQLICPCGKSAETCPTHKAQVPIWFAPDASGPALLAQTLTPGEVLRVIRGVLVLADLAAKVAKAAHVLYLAHQGWEPRIGVVWDDSEGPVAGEIRKRRKSKEQ